MVDSAVATDRDNLTRLVNLIGPTLVGFITNVKSSTSVGEWLNTDSCAPSEVQQEAINRTLQVLDRICEFEALGVALQWLTGGNIPRENSDDVSPAKALREGDFLAVEASVERMITDTWL